MINHFEMQAANMVEWGRAHDQIVDAGIPFWANIGQHSNDEAISFYTFNPSGYLMEFGVDCLDVTEELEVDWQINEYDSLSWWGHRLQCDFDFEALRKSWEASQNS